MMIEIDRRTLDILQSRERDAYSYNPPLVQQCSTEALVCDCVSKSLPIPDNWCHGIGLISPSPRQKARKCLLLFRGILDTGTMEQRPLVARYLCAIAVMRTGSTAVQGTPFIAFIRTTIATSFRGVSIDGSRRSFIHMASYDWIALHTDHTAIEVG